MDAAFENAPYPSYTSAELSAWVAEGHPRASIMQREVDRRVKVDAGDTSVMMPAERLRFNACGKAR